MSKSDICVDTSYKDISDEQLELPDVNKSPIAAINDADCKYDEDIDLGKSTEKFSSENVSAEESDLKNDTINISSDVQHNVSDHDDGLDQYNSDDTNGTTTASNNTCSDPASPVSQQRGEDQSCVEASSEYINDDMAVDMSHEFSEKNIDESAKNNASTEFLKHNVNNSNECDTSDDSSLNNFSNKLVPKSFEAIHSRKLFPESLAFDIKTQYNNSFECKGKSSKSQHHIYDIVATTYKFNKIYPESTSLNSKCDAPSKKSINIDNTGTSKSNNGSQNLGKSKLFPDSYRSRATNLGLRNNSKVDFATLNSNSVDNVIYSINAGATTSMEGRPTRSRSLSPMTLDIFFKNEIFGGESNVNDLLPNTDDRSNNSEQHDDKKVALQPFLHDVQKDEKLDTGECSKDETSNNIKIELWEPENNKLESSDENIFHDNIKKDEIPDDSNSLTTENFHTDDTLLTMSRQKCDIPEAPDNHKDVLASLKWKRRMASLQHNTAMHELVKPTCDNGYSDSLNNCDTSVMHFEKIELYKKKLEKCGNSEEDNQRKERYIKKIKKHTHEFEAIQSHLKELPQPSTSSEGISDSSSNSKPVSKPNTGDDDDIIVDETKGFTSGKRKRTFGWSPFPARSFRPARKKGRPGDADVVDLTVDVDSNDDDDDVTVLQHDKPVVYLKTETHLRKRKRPSKMSDAPPDIAQMIDISTADSPSQSPDFDDAGLLFGSLLNKPPHWQSTLLEDGASTSAVSGPELLAATGSLDSSNDLQGPSSMNTVSRSSDLVKILESLDTPATDFRLITSGSTTSTLPASNSADLAEAAMLAALNEGFSNNTSDNDETTLDFSSNSQRKKVHKHGNYPFSREEYMLYPNLPSPRGLIHSETIEDSYASPSTPPVDLSRSSTGFDISHLPPSASLGSRSEPELNLPGGAKNLPSSSSDNGSAFTIVFHKMQNALKSTVNSVSDLRWPFGIPNDASNSNATKTTNAEAAVPSQSDSVVDLEDEAGKARSSQATPSTSKSNDDNSSSSANEISCPICLDTLAEIKADNNSLASTNCGHLFCEKCIHDTVKRTKQCPTCRKKLTKRQIHKIYL